MPGLTEADKTTIRDISQKVLEIANNKPTDWDAYTRMYYTEDAVVMPPNTPVVTGRAAIRDFLSGMPPITNFKIVDVEIDGGEDKAWVHGIYTMTLSPPGTSPMEDVGKYMEVWRKEPDGTWKVTHDMFNSDLPPAGA
jgi:ketosteroid isomerase-like protein